MTLTVAFSVDVHRLALPLSLVTQVTRAAAITPVPNAPAIVMGVVDFHGEIIPVMNVRVRLGLEARPMSLTDQMVITRTPLRAIAFVVDRVLGLAEWDDADFVPASAVVPDVAFLEGIARDHDGLILLYDPDAFLRTEEAHQLAQAMSSYG